MSFRKKLSFLFSFIFVSLFIIVQLSAAKIHFYFGRCKEYWEKVRNDGDKQEKGAS